MPFDTPLSPDDEKKFQAWKQQNAPQDSGEDYDFRGAFKAGLTPGPDQHWRDTYKKPNHPTFSDESIYSSLTGTKPGHWSGMNNDEYTPFDKLKMLGQISMKNDPTFDANNHLAQQLNSGPFKESAERHKVWQQAGVSAGEVKSPFQDPDRPPTPQAERTPQGVPSAEQEALQDPLFEPLDLLTPGKKGGALGLKMLTNRDKDEIAAAMLNTAYQTSKHGAPALALPTYGDKKKRVK